MTSLSVVEFHSHVGNPIDLVEEIVVANDWAHDRASEEELIVEMEKAAAEGNAHHQAISNAQFHGLIVEAAQNSTLLRLWALLEPWARTYLTAARAGVDLNELALRHRKILTPLRRRDPEGAADAMRDHLLEAAEWLRHGDQP